MEHALLEAKAATPQKDGAAIRWLERFAKFSGSAADRLLASGGPKESLKRVKLLDETRREWARQEGFKELYESYDWLSTELSQELAALRKAGVMPPAVASEADLERLKNALRQN
jgi:hypothetical protein